MTQPEFYSTVKQALCQKRFNNKEWKISTDAHTSMTNTNSHGARWTLMMDAWTNDGCTSIIRIKLNNSEPEQLQSTKYVQKTKL